MTSRVVAMGVGETLRKAAEPAAANDPIEVSIGAQQERLFKAVLRLPMDPAQAAITAFTNIMLSQVRFDAMRDVLFTPIEGETDECRETRYRQRLLHHMTERAQELESKAPIGRILVAQPIGRA